MGKPSLVTRLIPAILIAGATLFPLKSLSQSTGYLPQELKGIELSSGEIDYFNSMQSTPELLKERLDLLIRYDNYTAAIDYTKKAMVYAYTTKNRPLIFDLERDLKNLTSINNFIESMNFGIYSSKEGKIIVYDYLPSNLEDSASAKYLSILNGRGKLIHSEKERFSKSNKPKFENEEIKVMGYGDKTIYLYSFKVDSNKTTKEILKSHSPLPDSIPFKK
jgi:hypothetical protein